MKYIAGYRIKNIRLIPKQCHFNLLIFSQNTGRFNLEKRIGIELKFRIEDFTESRTGAGTYSLFCYWHLINR
jgi:hypothetical protein